MFTPSMKTCAFVPSQVAEMLCQRPSQIPFGVPAARTMSPPFQT